jgi:hypothetical protein
MGGAEGDREECWATGQPRVGLPWRMAKSRAYSRSLPSLAIGFSGGANYFGPSFTVSLLIVPVKRNGTW